MRLRAPRLPPVRVLLPPVPVLLPPVPVPPAGVRRRPEVLLLHPRAAQQRLRQTEPEPQQQGFCWRRTPCAGGFDEN